MPFSFEPEQRAFAETVTDTLTRHCPISVVRAAADDPDAWRDVWGHLVELDLPGLLVPEQAGGLGLSPVEMVAIVEAAGRFAAPVPLTTTVGAFAALVVAAGDGTTSATAMLERILAGTPATVALPFEHSGAPLVVLRGHRITGTRSGIPDASRAGLVAMPVLREEDDRVVLLVGEPSDLGVRASPAMDAASPVGSLQVTDHDIGPSTILDGDPRRGYPVACTAAAAELVGIAAELVDRTVQYARERIQFGQPIGAFQAVKHRLVDAHVAVERARSLTRYAALVTSQGTGATATLAGHRAKAAASEAASGAARAAVQIHGGVGVTAEHDVSVLYVRARQLSALLGGPDFHYARAAVAQEAADDGARTAATAVQTPTGATMG